MCNKFNCIFIFSCKRPFYMEMLGSLKPASYTNGSITRYICTYPSWTKKRHRCGRSVTRITYFFAWKFSCALMHSSTNGCWRHWIRAWSGNVNTNLPHIQSEASSLQILPAPQNLCLLPTPWPSANRTWGWGWAQWLIISNRKKEQELQISAWCRIIDVLAVWNAEILS